MSLQADKKCMISRARREGSSWAKFLAKNLKLGTLKTETPLARRTLSEMLQRVSSWDDIRNHLMTGDM